MLHTAASRVGGLDIGFVPGEGGTDRAGDARRAAQGELDVLFLLGADEIDVAALGSAFVVYIGTHGDAGAHRADVILPGAAYTEKSGTCVNTEGRVQIGEPRGLPAGRCARGLVDPARALRRARQDAAVRLASRQLRARALRGASAYGGDRRHRAGGAPRISRALGERGGSLGSQRVRQPDPRLLPDQSDRARLGRDGRMLGDAAGPVAEAAE